MPHRRQPAHAGGGGRSWIGVLAAGRVSDVLLTLLTLNMLARPITGGWIFTKMGLPAPPVGISVALWALFVAFRGAVRRWHPGFRRELFDAVWQRRFEVGVAALFAVGLALRLWGISYGLPVITHPDEPDPIGVALGMLQVGTLDPNWFYYGTLYIYLLLPFFGLHYISLKGSGAMRVITDVSRLEPSFYRIARMISAFAGALTIVLVYVLTTRLWKGTTGKRAGVIAAAVLTFSFLHVRQSHYAVTDAVLVFLITASLIAIMKVLSDGGRRDYFLAGLLIGLAGATKYSAVPLLLILALAHFMGRPAKRWVSVEPLVGFSGVVVGFLGAMPYAVLNWTKFLDHMGFLRSISSMNTDPINRFAWLFGYSFESGFGSLLASMVWASIVVAIYRRRPPEILLAVHALLFLGLITHAEIRVMPRYWLPAIPAVAVLVGGYVSEAADWVQERFALPTGATAAGTFALVAIAVLPTAQESVQFDRMRAKPDSRAAAYVWLNDNYPEGTTVASEAWIRGVPRGVEFERAEPAHEVTLEEWRERGVDVVLFSTDWDKTLTRNQRATERRPVVRTHLRRLHYFPGYEDGLSGPGLTAYEVPPAADEQQRR